MFSTAGKIVGLAALVIVAGVALTVYYEYSEQRRQLARLEEQKRQLEQVVERLSAERRVAEVLVTDQRRDGGGVLETTLLVVEYDRSQNPLAPREFTVRGDMIHVDAMVIKFERDFVAKDDPLRGHSIALFTRIYGDQQSPNEGSRIDEPGRIPEVYRGTDPAAAEFEKKLWSEFWRLADDAEYRKEMGVRIANGQGVWGPFRPDRLYTLTIESDGGVNLTSEPLRGIYREALKRRAGSP